MRAQQAAFRDLLRLPARTVELHAFQLEGDAIVGAVADGRRRARSHGSGSGEATPPAALFADEVLTSADVTTEGLDATTAAWLALRYAASGPRPTPAYSGFVDARPPQSYRVSRVDRYVDCPFKYFSESVLELPEERDEMSGLTPLERGTLVHALFERFYQAWQREGRGTITTARMPDALELFRDDRRRLLAGCRRRIARSKRRGCSARSSRAAWPSACSSSKPTRAATIVDRLVELELRGHVPFPASRRPRPEDIEIRGKADRIDVFDDGSLRVVDYKLGRLPDLKTSVQIAVYAHCARQSLEARDGQPHQVSVGDVPRVRRRAPARRRGRRMARSADEDVDARAVEFADIVEHIEAGEFPPKPRKTGDCAVVQVRRRLPQGIPARGR